MYPSITIPQPNQQFVWREVINSALIGDTEMEKEMKRERNCNSRKKERDTWGDFFIMKRSPCNQGWIREGERAVTRSADELPRSKNEKRSERMLPIAVCVGKRFPGGER